jgi:hypothetical protein
MMEHIQFWTSRECPPMSREDMELIEKLAHVVGIRLVMRAQLEIAEAYNNK